jgi:hypothetical protein
VAIVKSGKIKSDLPTGQLLPGRRSKMSLLGKLFKELRILFKIILGMFLALHMAGCISSTESTEFPIGLFDCVECQGFKMRFSNDGAYVIYMRGIEFITGKWYVENDVFYTGDSYCRDEDAMPASYKWHFEGKILTFQVIEDECSDRVSSLDGKPWKIIEEE